LPCGLVWSGLVFTDSWRDIYAMSSSRQVASLDQARSSELSIPARLFTRHDGHSMYLA
jgi:hypothetical protein